MLLKCFAAANSGVLEGCRRPLSREGKECPSPGSRPLFPTPPPPPTPSYTGGIRGEGKGQAETTVPRTGWVWTKLVRFRTISESAHQRNLRCLAAFSAIAKSAPQCPPFQWEGKPVFVPRIGRGGEKNPTSHPPFSPRAEAPPNSSGLESSNALNFLKLP